MKKFIAVALVLLAGVLFLSFNTVEAMSLISENGYAMPTNKIEEELVKKSGKMQEKITMVELQEEDMVYAKGSKYYVGDDKKTISLDYPLIMGEGYKLHFLQNNAYLVSEDFEVLPALEGMYLANARSFTSDGKEADLVSFLLTQLSNGLYMNAQTMKITTQLESFDVPLYSILHFDKAFINYYAYEGGSYRLVHVRGLQNAKISIGKHRWSYSEFLDKLTMVKKDVEKQEDKKEEDKEEVEDVLENATLGSSILTGSNGVSKPSDQDASNKQPQEENTSKPETNTPAPQQPQTPQEEEGTILPGKPQENDSNGGNSSDEQSGNDNEEILPPSQSETPENNSNGGNSNNEQGGNGSEEIVPPTKPEQPEQPENDPNGDNSNSEEGENGDEGGSGEDEEEEQGEGDEPGGLPEGEEQEPGEGVEPVYEEPQVSFKNLKPWVYTLHGDLTISDPASRIIRSVRITIYNEEGTPVLRKQFKNSETINLSIIEPDESFVVEGMFQYYDEVGNKKEKIFLAKTAFHTLPIKDNVAPVDMEYEFDDVLLPESIHMNNVALKNTSDYDPSDPSLENFYKNTLPYISSVRLSFTDKKTNETITTNFPSSLMKKLIQGKREEFISSAIFPSASEFDYAISLVDKYDNEIPLKKEIKGSVATSKLTPKATIKTKESTAGKFVFDVTIDDKDQAMLKKDYIIKIFDASGRQLLLQGKMSDGSAIEADSIITSGNQTIEINNLPFSQLLSMSITTDYNTENGEGDKIDAVIASSQFYSAPISVGAITYANTFSDVMGSYITMDLDISSRSTLPLVSLMTDFEIEFTSRKGENFSYSIDKDLINSATLEDYDDERKELVIQEANAETKQPYIALAVDKALLEEGSFSNWELWTNKGNVAFAQQSGTLRIRLSENTLTPSTKYTAKIKSHADQGNYIYDLQSNLTRESFTTKKREPQVQMGDYFIGSTFIEFYDIFTEDVDGTILQGNYSIQLRKDGQVINSQDLKTNEKFDTIRFSELSKGADYQICFVAAAYNDGESAATLIENHVFKEVNFTAGNGISANLTLHDFDIDYNNPLMEQGKLKQDEIIHDKVIDSNTYQMKDNPERFVSGFIPVDLNKDYILKDAGGSNVSVYFYKDTTSNPLGYDTKGGTVSRITKEALASHLHGAKYIRIVGWKGHEETTSFFEFKASKGLLNEDMFVLDTKIDKNTGEEAIAVGTATTDFMEVEQGEIYLLDHQTNFTYAYYYDEYKEFVVEYNISGKTFEIPSGVKYMRIVSPSYASNKDKQLYRVEDLGNREMYKGTIEWTIEDMMKILTKDDTYQLDIYTNSNPQLEANQLVDSMTYSFTEDNDGKVIPVHEQLEQKFKPDHAYRYELSMMYNGNKVVLASNSFQTKANIHLVYTMSDLNKIHSYPNDTFIAMNDIVENSIAVQFNKFNGTLDFQGHTLRLTKTNAHHCFENLRPNGTIKNMKVEGIRYGFFIANNYGKVENVVSTIEPHTSNMQMFAFIGSNYGSLENFAFEIQEDLYLTTNDGTNTNSAGVALGIQYNYGIIRNGYIYHKDGHGTIAMQYNETFTKGVLVGSNQERGSIENVYALSDLADSVDSSDVKSISGLLVGSNGGRLRNAFAVGDRKGYTKINGEIILKDYLPTMDPSLGINTTVNSYKNQNVSVYAQHNPYEKQLATRIDESNLNSLSWYQKNLAGSSFNLEANIPYGFYPRVQMDESMMKHQPYIPLPQYVEGKQPLITSSEILKETNDYVDVLLHMNNEGKALITSVEMENVDARIMEQGENKKEYYVKLRLSNPTKFVSQYKLKTFHFETGGKSQSSDVLNYMVDAHFYKPISSFSDWESMKQSPKENYRLMTDLDFSLLSDYNVVYINEFGGILDGGIYDHEGNLTGMHVLKNIELGKKHDTLFNKLVSGSEIKNLRVENLSNVTEREATYDIALIYEASSAIFDNIHFKDVNFKMSKAAPLVRFGTNVILQNCSATNVKMIEDKNRGYAGFAGLARDLTASIVRNCYTKNIDFQAPLVSTTASDIRGGGIVGVAKNTRIENCYSQGKIIMPSYIGGIVGESSSYYTTNCWSDVYLEASNTRVGGIDGAGANPYLQHNLALGNILCTNATATYVHRIAGSPIYSGYHNYAYAGQTINNNQNLGLDDTDGLLSDEQLMQADTYLYQIGLGDAYDYSVVSNGQLPLLKSTNGELLPYQEAMYFDKGNNKLTIESGIRLDSEDKQFKTTMVIEHPGFSYVGAQIDGMGIDDEKVDKLDENRTRVTLTTTKTKAQDSYKLTVQVKSNKGTRVQELTGVIEYQGGPVYWYIDSLTTWEDIVEDGHGKTLENFKIMQDIDFEEDMAFGDLRVNRLEGIHSDIKIKNIKGRYEGSKDYANFIAYSKAGIKNLIFENCHYDYSLSARRDQIALIGSNAGTLENVIFDTTSVNVTASADGWSYSVGMVGYQGGGVRNVHGIDVQVIYDKPINSKDHGSYIGALFGQLNSDMRNVSLTSRENSEHASQVYAPYLDNVGGLAGMNYLVNVNTNQLRWENLSVSNTNIEGRNNVGGVVGYFSGTLNNAYITDSTVIGKNDVGGISGRFGGVSNSKLTANNGYTVSNVTVEGYQRVGGVCGLNGFPSSIKMKTVTVRGERVVGGVSGQGGSTSSAHLDDIHVFAEYAAGGIGGGSVNISNSYVLNSEVEAYQSYAGGLVGAWGVYSEGEGYVYEGLNGTYLRYSGVVDTKIKANEYAGGMAGFKNVTNSKTYGFVKDSQVSAQRYAGGIAGAAKNYMMEHSYVADTDITASDSYAGGFIGYVKAGGSVFDAYRSYVFTNVTAEKGYAAGLVGGFEEGFAANNPCAWTSTIMQTNVNSPEHASVTFNNFDIFKNAATNFKLIKVSEASTLNGKKVTSDDLQDQEAMQLVTNRNLSTPPIYSATIAAVGDIWRTYATYAYVDDLMVLPLGGKEVSVGILDSDYSGPAYFTQSWAGATQTRKDIMLENGRANVTLDITLGIRNGMKYTLTVGDQTWETTVDRLYLYQEKPMEIEDLDQILEIGDTITLPQGHTYKWYRSVRPSYEYPTEYVGYHESSLTVENRGYYFAIDENGVHSPIYFVNGIGYMPYLIIKSNNVLNTLPYQEGKDENGNYKQNNNFFMQGGVEIPRYEVLKPLTSASAQKALPDFEVYASGVNAINVELMEEVGEDYELVVEVDGKKQTYPMEDRVLALGYDFMSEMSLTLKANEQSKTKIIQPEDVRKTISAYDEHYYYLVDDGIASDTKTYDLEGIHLYEDKALLRDGVVFDLLSGEEKASVENGELLEAQALTSFDINGYHVDTYAGFSKVKGEHEEHRDVKLFMKHGKLFAIDGNVSLKGNGVIVDEYQGEMIQTQLNEDGTLTNYMDGIVTPKGFKNKDIKEITHTLTSDSALMLVRYEDGDLDAFNYLNGERHEVEGMKEDKGFLGFVKDQLDVLFSSDVDQMDDRYETAFQLQKELAVLDKETQKHLLVYEDKSSLAPQAEGVVHEAASPYTTLYDAESDSYQTYDVDTLLASSDETRLSENEKLQQLKKEGMATQIDDALLNPKKDFLEERSAQLGLGAIGIGVVGCLFVIVKKRKQWIGKA